tara:strand:- start:844 stop:1242 length:399 start_codon:yes stop_codon:yes gene_type:complete
MKYLILLLIFLAACTSTPKVCYENSCFEVEVAETLEQQSLGLMFRDSLDQNKGMLFVYESTEPRSFWMQNTFIPLDIIWIDSNFKVTKIQRANPCQGPCEVYTGYGQYILELNQGTANNLGLEVGEEIKIKI